MPVSPARRFIHGLAIALAASCAAQAAPSAWQLNWENDSWLRGGTDRWYTNGIRLSWGWACSEEQALGRTLHDYTSLLSAGTSDEQWGCDSKRGPREGNTPRIVYTLGQTMYTPSDITRSTPQLQDRPWAAFAYWAASTLRSKGPWASATELKLGVIGPQAQGEAAQKFIHHVVHAPQPQGWDHQVRNRPGVQFSQAWSGQVRPWGNDWVALQASASGSLGSVRVLGGLGAALVVGDLSAQESPLFIGNEGDFVVQDFRNLSQFNRPYGYVSFGNTWVGRNWLLQSRTPDGPSALVMRRQYDMVQWGLSVPLPIGPKTAGTRLIYAQTTRGPEFISERAQNLDRRQRWATLSLVVDLK